MTCVVTALDDNSIDLDAPLVVVGRRKHIEFRFSDDAATTRTGLFVRKVLLAVSLRRYRLVGPCHV